MGHDIDCTEQPDSRDTADRDLLDVAGTGIGHSAECADLRIDEVVVNRLDRAALDKARNRLVIAMDHTIDAVDFFIQRPFNSNSNRDGATDAGSPTRPPARSESPTRIRPPRNVPTVSTTVRRPRRAAARPRAAAVVVLPTPPGPQVTSRSEVSIAPRSDVMCAFDPGRPSRRALRVGGEQSVGEDVEVGGTEA